MLPGLIPAPLRSHLARGAGTPWAQAVREALGTLPGRNVLANGDFRIDQRNSGAAQTLSAGAVTYTADRWYAYPVGAAVTGQRVAGSNGEPYVYRITGAAGVTVLAFGQRVEAADSAYMAGQTVTLSALLSNSLLTTVTWTLSYANAADDFSSRTQIASGSFTVTSTLARFNAQAAIPAAATTGLLLEFSVGAQISGTWRIGAAQLELGSTATPFERVPVAQQLARCQRYWWKLEESVALQQFGNVNSNGYQTVRFPVRMRASPTITPTVTGPVNIVTSIVNTGPGGFQLKGTCGSPSVEFAAVLSAATADAEL